MSHDCEFNPLEELVRQNLLGIIVEMMGGPYYATSLRATCRFARKYVPRIPFKAKDVNQLVIYACTVGHEGTLRFARDLALSSNVDIMDYVVNYSAHNGNERFCRLAKEWGGGVIKVYIMGHIAAKAGHEGICRLAIEWGAEPCAGLLAAAADGALENLCRFIIEKNGNRSIYGSAINVLFNAASKGHEGICRMAKDMGATDFNRMLYTAAGNNHKDLCLLAREWGATDFNRMIYSAVSNGHEGICRLAKDWGVMDWDYMLLCAAEHGSENLCRLAKEWGATDVNRMFKRARFPYGDGILHHICDLAIEWGANGPIVDEYLAKK